MLIKPIITGALGSVITNVKGNLANLEINTTVETLQENWTPGNRENNKQYLGHVGKNLLSPITENDVNKLIMFLEKMGRNDLAGLLEAQANFCLFKSIFIYGKIGSRIFRRINRSFKIT